jgi:hypothetical protein
MEMFGHDGMMAEVTVAVAVVAVMVMVRAVVSWSGGHRNATAGTAAVPEASTPEECTLCLRSDPALIQLGCACRGLAHVECLAEAAENAGEHSKMWWRCEVCKQQFTGLMQLGLAVMYFARVEGVLREQDSEWQYAAECLARAHHMHGEDAKAEKLYRLVIAIKGMTLGPEHSSTLLTGTNLARCLFAAGKYAEAETMYVDPTTDRCEQRVWL